MPMEFLLFGLLKSPRERFSHGDEVVSARICANAESAVRAFVRLTVGKDHHRGHGIAPLNVRVIKALYARWHRLKAEDCTELRQRALAAGFRPLSMRAALDELAD